MDNTKVSTKELNIQIINLKDDLNKTQKSIDQNENKYSSIEIEIEELKQDLKELDKELDEFFELKESLLDQISVIEGILNAQNYPIYSHVELEEAGQMVFNV